MKDYLLKALAYDGKIRAYAVNTTNLVNQLQKNHNTTPTASAALGRAATIGAMMGAMLKGEEKLTIQVAGDGPIGQVIIDANAKGVVRGYVTNPEVDLPPNEKGKLDVAGAVGSGTIYVIKDLGMRDPYRGSTPIISGELGEDFTYYFSMSEQTPSAVGVGVLVDPNYSIRASGGFIIQLMPGVPEDIINLLDQTLASIPPISSLIDQGNTPENILEKLFGEYKILEKMDIEFSCNCSKERIGNVLKSLGKEDLEDIIEKEEKAEVICQFCREAYQFSKEELRFMLNDL